MELPKAVHENNSTKLGHKFFVSHQMATQVISLLKRGKKSHGHWKRTWLWFCHAATWFFISWSWMIIWFIWMIFTLAQLFWETFCMNKRWYAAPFAQTSLAIPKQQQTIFQRIPREVPPAGTGMTGYSLWNGRTLEVNLYSNIRLAYAGDKACRRIKKQWKSLQNGCAEHSGNPASIHSNLNRNEKKIK